MSRQPLLIVNADDFGMTPGVSAGILDAHDHGIVTSTSVLANGRALTDYARRLLDTPTLGVGAHLAIVGEDPPLLSATEVPTLLDPTGRFCLTWKHFLGRAIAGRVDPEDITREFTAQLERVRGLGFPITHLDAHQHLQLWPRVGDVLLALAANAEIHAVRVPRYRHTTLVGASVSALATQLARKADRRGIRHTADSIGIAIAGHVDLPTLESVVVDLAARQPTSVELTVHPGRGRDPDRARYRWGYQWEQELATLISPSALASVRRAGFRLGTYDDLTADPPHAAAPTLRRASSGTAGAHETAGREGRSDERRSRRLHDDEEHHQVDATPDLGLR